VRKVFARGTVDEVTALNGVNLDVYAEDFVTVIGSNGAGKSTMLNIISGVYPPELGVKSSSLARISPCSVSISVLPTLAGYTRTPRWEPLPG